MDTDKHGFGTSICHTRVRGFVRKSFLRTGLELPALPIFVVKKTICFRVVGDLEILAVPIQFVAPVTDAGRSEQDCLG